MYYVVLRIIASGKLTWTSYSSKKDFESLFEAYEKDEKEVVEEGITADRCIELVTERNRQYQQ
jgi:hypothetical protein